VNEISCVVFNNYFNREICDDVLHYLEKETSFGFLTPKHDTIHVFNPYIHEYIDIDKGIADLIECLWLSNISTLNSCENNNPSNFVWIEFMDLSDLHNFLTIVFLKKKNNKNNDDICNRAFTASRKRGDWYYNIFACPDPNEHGGYDRIVVGVSIRFPQGDLEFILKQFKNHLKKINCTKSLIHDNERVLLKKTDVPVPSKKTDVSVSSKKTDMSVPSKKTDVAVSSKKTDVSVPSKKTDLSVSSKKTDVSVSSKKTDVSVSSKKTDVSVSSKKTDVSVPLKKTDIPVPSKKTDAPVSLKKTDVPVPSKKIDLRIQSKKAEKSRDKLHEKKQSEVKKTR
jgi:hypothetical protein